jgi:hypothetical protein
MPLPRNSEAPHLSERSQAHLWEKCRAHLRLEEAYLLQARACLIALNEALRLGKLAQIDQARATQEDLTQSSEGVSAQRTSLCDEISTLLNVPAEQVTLSRLIGMLSSPLSDELAAARDRLRQLVAEVHFLTQRNNSLINYCHSYFQRILNNAMDQVGPVVRYGRAGKQLNAVCGTFFVVQG